MPLPPPSLLRQGTITATRLRPRLLADKARIVTGVREQVWPLVDAGQIRPVIDRRLPMAEAAQAHQLVESGVHIGKVLLLNAGAA